ncbi:MAG: hypothetical protein KatS3mg094_124 [Candidatus Parcubacteria bacterium]|nr:MAG: hypothetical protein KatS3mg094_124 [Candidatus Parcubacteria bacterium]
MGNLIIYFSLILLGIGILIKLIESKIINLPLLPGDILIKKENFTFYFPLATSLIISLFISLILWIIFRK